MSNKLGIKYDTSSDKDKVFDHLKCQHAGQINDCQKGIVYILYG